MESDTVVVDSGMLVAGTSGCASVFNSSEVVGASSANGPLSVTASHLVASPSAMFVNKMVAPESPDVSLGGKHGDVVTALSVTTAAMMSANATPHKPSSKGRKQCAL